MPDTRPPVTPTLDLPLEDATQELTGFEALAIQKHFKATSLGEIGPFALTMGVVWAYENRREKTEWATVQAMTLRELHGYFAPTPSDPDSDEGKDSTDDEAQT